MSAHSNEEEVTMENNMEDMSSRTSSDTEKNLQQASAASTNTKKSLQYISSLYPLTKENIRYAQVPGENPENVFICHPVNDSTQEVKQKELSSVYGVECVQILDRIAFKDDDIE